MEDADLTTDDDGFGIVGLSQRTPDGMRMPLYPPVYTMTPRLLSPTKSLDAVRMERKRKNIASSNAGYSPAVAFQKLAYIQPPLGDNPKPTLSKRIQEGVVIKHSYTHQNQNEMPKLKLWLVELDEEDTCQVNRRKDGSLQRMATSTRKNNLQFGGLKQFSDYTTSYKSEKKKLSKIFGNDLENEGEPLIYSVIDHDEAGQLFKNTKIPTVPLRSLL